MLRGRAGTTVKVKVHSVLVHPGFHFHSQVILAPDAGQFVLSYALLVAYKSKNGHFGKLFSDIVSLSNQSRKTIASCWFTNNFSST